ncbi:hypothetical protein EI77_03406 [Prosthecobacter fusiformis]|uniref:Cellulose biosynthesis protein BcsQ n=1 Tax=Prosthecobacter fusiformis TaxID=48464 RepID=A0A4R7RNY9_9BACT|nr:hypothetical protein [Prosthecobacter fusiformis]TDU67204.1 hypothetical protein EI77_03406 [Prosthecobacter fusiformis]
MKKLILIQNDYPSTGKSTLAHCCARYLSQYGASHQLISLVEDAGTDTSGRIFDANTLTPDSLLDRMEDSPITILEIATGMGDFFEKLYQNEQLDLVFHEASISLSVVLPVTSEYDSFDSVLEAAEVYSDNAEYTIAHLITSSYEDDDKVWDTSYAARVMDMFEAVELYIPEIGFQLELELRSQHASLNEALMDPQADEHFGKDFTKWMSRVMGQVDSARQYLFGEAFRPTTTPKPVKRTRAKAKSL